MPLDLKTITSAISQIAEEKGIPKEKIIETIELALAAAYKREYGKKSEIIRARFDPTTGELSFWQVKLVVDESMLKKEEEEDSLSETLEPGERKIRFNPDRHIMLEEARKIKEGVLAGEELLFPLETHTDFGRIAAQTAKQVILQKIHEAERQLVFEEYKSKEGEIISGIIQRVEGRTVFIDLGKTVGVMFPDETVPTERYSPGARMKFYVLAVEENPRGPSVLLSRSHPRFVSKLFATEVPEIAEGIVEIKSIARDPGLRTKIAVSSNDEAIDPIGACVGQKGTRVNTVTAELGGEKIDIIAWSDDPAEFIKHALAPAKVVDVEIRARHEARVYVPADQLSLAIGKQGQNVRLAARLTGWKIEVRSSLRPEEKIEGGVAEAEPETGISEEIAALDADTAPITDTAAPDLKTILGKALAEKVAAAGFDSIEKLKNAPEEELLKIKGIGPKAVEKIKKLL
jgi:N utilization substance protein A